MKKQGTGACIFEEGDIGQKDMKRGHNKPNGDETYEKMMGWIYVLK